METQLVTRDRLNHTVYIGADVGDLRIAGTTIGVVDGRARSGTRLEMARLMLAPL